MLKTEIIKSFVQLGDVLTYMINPNPINSMPFPLDNECFDNFQNCIKSQKLKNGWFTEENVILSIKNQALNLSFDKLTEWQLEYGFATISKSILVIMAGNIPLVGFHDFVSVLISGHKIKCKLSSDDATLLPFISEILVKINPDFEKRISFEYGSAKDFQAVIATGSNNTIGQFKNYFSNYPCLFRKNRTSLAVIKGDETDEDLKKLGSDIFNYFGLGCRNVSHLIVPKKYDLNNLFRNIVSFSDIIYHNKYANNYDYHRAIFMLNKKYFLDNNFLIVAENEELVSPVSVLNYHKYEFENEILEYMNKCKDDIQVIVGKDYLEFGKSQHPSWSDYADNLNTMNFLLNL
jgi:hypothetical protein